MPPVAAPLLRLPMDGEAHRRIARQLLEALARARHDLADAAADCAAAVDESGLQNTDAAVVLDDIAKVLGAAAALFRDTDVRLRDLAA